MQVKIHPVVDPWPPALFPMTPNDPQSEQSAPSRPGVPHATQASSDLCMNSGCWQALLRTARVEKQVQPLLGHLFSDQASLVMSSSRHSLTLTTLLASPTKPQASSDLCMKPLTVSTSPVLNSTSNAAKAASSYTLSTVASTSAKRDSCKR